MSQLISSDVQQKKSYGFISEAKPSPSSRLPPEAAACCYVAGCHSSLGWHSGAHAGQVGGKHCDPEDQPRYRRGLWHSHPESVRLNAQTGKVSYCLSAPEERIHEQTSDYCFTASKNAKLANNQRYNWLIMLTAVNTFLLCMRPLCRSTNHMFGLDLGYH